MPLPSRPGPTDLASRFLRFGAVGGIGFLFDTATVYAARPVLGLYGAGLAAYLVAASVTWFANRTWTFRDRERAPLHRQWALFLAANSVGFVLNRGTYAALIATTAVSRAYPVLAILAGCVAGMGANFTLSQRLVFR